MQQLNFESGLDAEIAAERLTVRARQLGCTVVGILNNILMIGLPDDTRGDAWDRYVMDQAADNFYRPVRKKRRKAKAKVARMQMRPERRRRVEL
jgi:hypothetical protein